MESPELFAETLALVGAVIIIAALLSGLIERSGLPQVAVFLALGALLGGAIRIHPDEAVRCVSEINLDKDAWLIAFCA